jgi:hypothetical protein
VDPDTGAIITTPIGPVCAPGQDPNLSPGCYTSQGGSFLGTYDGRGDFNFNDWWRLDLSARYQFPIWKELSGWVKIDALNVTNQDTLTSFQTTGEVVDDGTFTIWTPSPEFGTIQSEDNYQTPREWLLTVGIQF